MYQSQEHALRVRSLVVGSAIFIVIATVFVWTLAVFLVSVGELSFGIGLMGVYLGLLSLGISGLVTATSIHASNEHYDNLTDKLDSISRRQEDLIALVHTLSQNSQNADPAAESPPAS